MRQLLKQVLPVREGQAVWEEYDGSSMIREEYEFHKENLEEEGQCTSEQ